MDQDVDASFLPGGWFSMAVGERRTRATCPSWETGSRPCSRRVVMKDGQIYRDERSD